MKQNEEKRRHGLIAARMAKGLSIDEAAKLLNYAVGSLKAAENGNRYSGKRLYKSGEEFFRRASELYGVPIEDLKRRGRE